MSAVYRGDGGTPWRVPRTMDLPPPLKSTGREALTGSPKIDSLAFLQTIYVRPETLPGTVPTPTQRTREQGSLSFNLTLKLDRQTARSM